MLKLNKQKIFNIFKPKPKIQSNSIIQSHFLTPFGMSLSTPKSQYHHYQIILRKCKAFINSAGIKSLKECPPKLQTEHLQILDAVDQMIFAVLNNINIFHNLAEDEIISIPHDHSLWFGVKLLQREWDRRHEQRTASWFASRGLCITASEVAPALGKGKYKTRKAYIAEKSKPSVKWSNQWTRHGNKYENAVKLVFNHKHGVQIYDLPFLVHPVHSFIGASPDGIIFNGNLVLDKLITVDEKENTTPNMANTLRSESPHSLKTHLIRPTLVEIKCPKIRIPTGEVPIDYAMQMQLQMATAGIDKCIFIDSRISEYRCEEEFVKDSSPEYKGIVVCFFDPKLKSAEREEDMSYHYVPITGGVASQIAEAKRVSLAPPSGLKFEKMSYWKLEGMIAVEYEQDPMWLTTNLGLIKATWDEIQQKRKEYAEDPELLKRDIEKGKRAPKPLV